MEVTRTVRPTIASRQLYITRSSTYGPQSSSSRGGERSSRSSYGTSGALATINQQGGGFAEVKSTRDKEKRDMQVRQTFHSSIVLSAAAAADDDDRLSTVWLAELI